MKKNRKIYNYLSSLDFCDNEIQAYLGLLSIGPSNLAKLTKRTKIARTTLVRAVEKLIEKGMISQSVKNSERILLAESPRKLENLIRSREIDISEELEEVKKKKERLEVILPLLTKNENEDGILVRYYEGVNGFIDVCNRSLMLANEEICFLSNHNNWRKVFTEEYDLNHYVPKRIQKGIKMKSLVLKNEQGYRLREQDTKKLRETRYLPDSYDFDGTFIIYDGEVSIMVSFKPYYAINVRNKVVSGMFKSIFENIWQTV